MNTNCCSPAGETLGILMILPCLQEDTLLLFSSRHEIIAFSLWQPTALSGQTHWKHYLNHIFSLKCLIYICVKVWGPTTSSRSFHLFLWQIKILKSRWGVSICYANLRSVHRPLIHDLWKQLTFSWSCRSPSSARIDTQLKLNLYFNIITIILGLLLMLFTTWLK